MEGFGSKLSGDLSTYKYGTSTPTFGGGSGTGSGTPASVTTPSYTVQERQMDGAVGGSGVEELVDGGGGGLPSGGGRKKKKKHKSGEDSSASAKPSAVVEEDLVDAALPMLSDNQDVEDLLFPSTLPPPGGTLVGGQYLNNSLLDQILTEKKMQLLQSPEVMEFLQKQLAKK